MNKAEARRKKNKQKKEMIIIGVIASVFVVTIVIFTLSLRSKVLESEEKIIRLENQIAEEKKRTEELESQEAFMNSSEFIEKIARERLGLISPGETIIKPDN